MINASKALVSGWTLVLSGVMVAVIGLAVTGDAFAIDQPGNPRGRAASKTRRRAEGRPEAGPRRSPTRRLPNPLSQIRAGPRPNKSNHRHRAAWRQCAPNPAGASNRNA